MPSRSRCLLGAALTTTGALVAGALGAVPAAAASPDVVVAEVYGGGGNSGATLRNDFVELRNDSAAPVDVTGWTVEYASAAGSSWSRTALTGSIAPGARYLVQQAAGNGGTAALPAPDATGTSAMSASAGKVRLVLPDGTVRDLVAYGPTATPFEGSGPAPAATNTTSVARAGADTDDNRADFAAGAPTPEGSGGDGGGGGTEEPPPAAGLDCAAPPTGRASDVQGSGAATPLAGQPVSIEGVVVADLQDGGFGGFHLQDLRPDGDAATSDAVFVAASRAVALGDRVQVSGTAAEENGLTRVTAGEVLVCGTAELPAAAALPVPSSDAQREALEGMRVAPAGTLTVSDLFGLGRFGELVLSSGGVLPIPTEVAEPGPAADAVRADNQRRRILLDDGRSADLSRTGEALPFLTLEDPVRVGDAVERLDDVVLSFGFGAWRLQPADGTADGTTFAATNPRPEAPAAVGGRHRLASFNVLNYFTTVPSGEGGRSPRGADSAEELAQQEAKIVTAINALGADVVALMEIENSAALGEAPDEALSALVAALNRAAGEGTWAYVPSPADLPPAAEQDVITNAIIYKPGRVERFGESTALTDAPGTPAAEADWDNAREPVAQAFVARGDRFTVVANHFKSKGSGGATGANRDQGQGAYNADRVGQAEALAAWVPVLRERSRDDDVVLMGDFNAYTLEDPLDVLRGAGFDELESTTTPGEASYVFGGESGSLDHALASASMAPKVTGVDVWGINSPESPAYQYDGPEALYDDDQFRASDHDPVVVGFEPVPGRSGR